MLIIVRSEGKNKAFTGFEGGFHNVNEHILNKPVPLNTGFVVSVTKGGATK